MKKLSQYVEQKMINEALEHVIANSPHIPENTIRHYYNHALDDSDKSDRMLHFLLKLHNNNSISPEMSDFIKPHMAVITRANLKSRLNGINSLEDLQTLTSPHMHLQKTKKVQTDENMPIEIDTPNITVRRIKNHPAAIKAAFIPNDNIHKPELDKAKWCVSLDNDTSENRGSYYFNHYTKGNTIPMYTIEDKKNKRLHAIIHNPEDSLKEIQYRDEFDRTPNQELHPEDDNSHLLPSLYADILKKNPELVNHKIGQDLLARPSIKLHYDTATTTNDVMNEFHKTLDDRMIDVTALSGIMHHPKFDPNKIEFGSLSHQQRNMTVNAIKDERNANVILNNDIIVNHVPPSVIQQTLNSTPTNSHVLTKILHTHINDPELSDNIYGVKRIINGVMGNANANAEHITTGLNYLGDNKLGMDSETLERVLKNKNLNQSHISQIHSIMSKNDHLTHTRVIFYSHPAVPKHMLLSALEKNTSTSDDLAYNIKAFPKEVSQHIVNNVDNYGRNAVEKALHSPNISYNDVSHLLHTHYNRILERHDVPQHVIDDIMSKHPDTDFGDHFQHYAAQLTLLLNDKVNKKIKKEHLQAIIDRGDVHNSYFASNIIHSKNEWGV